MQKAGQGKTGLLLTPAPASYHPPLRLVATPNTAVALRYGYLLSASYHPVRLGSWRAIMGSQPRTAS